ncbi:MAG: bacillithiol biosynthesis cysteine-adding enzyme BshC, partial [Sphingobacterium sp.]
MKATYIDYKDTQSFSKTLLAYLDNEEALAPFYGNRPDWDGFQEQIKNKGENPHRALLYHALREQYGESLLSSSPEVAENISRLSDSKTFTVTTGHQLNIFTGPLYFIFKIISTIRLAHDLKEKFPDYQFVPIYWMATEDHDFPEINHTRAFGKKVSWDLEETAATGRIATDTITETVKQYCNTFGLSENATQLTHLVQQAYRQGSNLADATRTFVNALFKRYGLVILDADRPDLKKVFAPIIERDILQSNSFKAIQNTSNALIDRGFEAQVHAREINFFYLTDDFRERIVPTDDGQFEVLNRNISWTEDSLKEEIQAYPERFSPNVVMRPVYQEVLLPNLAYIGGGAEIAYWLQLKASFDAYKIQFPILVPRNSALITDDQTAGKVFRLDFTFKSVFKSAEMLKNDFV